MQAQSFIIYLNYNTLTNNYIFNWLLLLLIVVVVVIVVHRVLILLAELSLALLQEVRILQLAALKITLQRAVEPSGDLRREERS